MNLFTVLSPRLITLGLLLAFTGAGLKANPADAILERYLEVSGGRAQIEAIRDVVMEGEVRMNTFGVRGDIVMALKSPDKVMMELQLPGIGRMVSAYNGKIAWSHDPIQGYRQISDEEARQMRDFSSLQKMLDFRQTYPVRRLRGAEEINGQIFDVVDLQTAEGDQMTLKFRRQDGLPTILETEVNMGPGGTIKMTAISHDFQRVNGILFPFRVEIRHPVMPMEMVFSDIRINVGVQDGTFEHRP